MEKGIGNTHKKEVNARAAVIIHEAFLEGIKSVIASRAGDADGHWPAAENLDGVLIEWQDELTDVLLSKERAEKRLSECIEERELRE